ncbi:hypothetical protein L2E82_10641 [Cichorium intybus]|uniref:Uncharacterized protein n=1 Tax=Cichorium intybus TaxID=13427 RepID=A0ACB9GCD5_CICIN|nr:hypothetical protein L2E82_10641 [Cichorium intybus]
MTTAGFANTTRFVRFGFPPLSSTDSSQHRRFVSTAVSPTPSVINSFLVRSVFRSEKEEPGFVNPSVPICVDLISHVI